MTKKIISGDSKEIIIFLRKCMQNGKGFVITKKAEENKFRWEIKEKD